MVLTLLDSNKGNKFIKAFSDKFKDREDVFAYTLFIEVNIDLGNENKLNILILDIIYFFIYK